MGDSGSMYLKQLPLQLGKAGLYLAIIAGLHYSQLLIMMPTLRWTLVGVIVIGGFVPVRFADLASGIGFLAVGGVGYFHYNDQLIGLLCGVFGVMSLASGIRALRTVR